MSSTQKYNKTLIDSGCSYTYVVKLWYLPIIKGVLVFIIVSTLSKKDIGVSVKN